MRHSGSRKVAEKVAEDVKVVVMEKVVAVKKVVTVEKVEKIEEKVVERCWQMEDDILDTFSLLFSNLYFRYFSYT
jgi:negative regulator of replication initiation